MTFVRLPSVADEVVQETWLAVINGLDRFEGRAPGSPRSFRFTRVVSAHGSTATSLTVPARLTGGNLAAARATATVLLSPHPVACGASAAPPARIAC